MQTFTPITAGGQPIFCMQTIADGSLAIAGQDPQLWLWNVTATTPFQIGSVNPFIGGAGQQPCQAMMLYNKTQLIAATKTNIEMIKMVSASKDLTNTVSALTFTPGTVYGLCLEEFSKFLN
jgi:hypothetical protein